MIQGHGLRSGAILGFEVDHTLWPGECAIQGKNRTALQSPPTRARTANGRRSWQANSTACHRTHSVVRFLLVALPNVTSDPCVFFSLGPVHEANIATPCNDNPIRRTSLLLLSQGQPRIEHHSRHISTCSSSNAWLGPQPSRTYARHGELNCGQSTSVVRLRVLLGVFSKLVVTLHRYSTPE